MRNKAPNKLLTVIVAITIGAFALNSFADLEQELKPRPDRAYLIFDLVLLGDEPQPTWLALRYRHKTIHLANHQSIVEIRPGEYVLSHIDFEDNIHSGKDTQHFRANSRLFIDPGKIYYLGRITLSKVRKDQYDVSYSINEELVAAACKAAPAVFDTVPVSTFDRLPDRMVSCTKQ